MKNLFFTLAFMLFGTFVFANPNEISLETPVVNTTETIAMNSAFEVSEMNAVAQDDVIIIVFDDGTVIIIVN